jgi:hypothetical protein
MSSGQSRITISRKLFTVAILVAILITACVSYTVLALIRTNTSESRLGDSGADPQTTSGNSNQTIANEENIFPTPSINQNGTIACPTGNWSSVYSFYEANHSSDLSITNGTLGEQYLNDPQFQSFLSQYLNMSDPFTNATMRELLAGDESAQIQQQLQLHSSQC